jgi:hypothetical protein
MLKYFFLCIIFLSTFVLCFSNSDFKVDRVVNSIDTIEPTFLSDEKKIISQQVNQKVPVRFMSSGNPEIMEAQEVATRDSMFMVYAFEPVTNKGFRNEIFSVSKVNASNFSNRQILEACQTGNCFRVENYNYALDITSVAAVDIVRKKVYSVQHYQHLQPEVPNRLKDLAVKIANESPEVIKALGRKPDSKEALMAATKTALNRSRCERSKHLCVAPTYIVGDKALWAIVDLTDLKLVGVRWTNTGSTSAFANKMVTERKLQNENITDQYCEIANKFSNELWKANFMLTSSDGLKISDVYFKEKRIIESAKLVDWHVSYSNADGFGYSDAIGCPYFSSAAVVAIEPPKIMDILDDQNKKIGSVIQQNFYSEGWPGPCNYNYCQRFEFFDDGRFRASCASLGRGCGNDGTYRPVTRIEFTSSKQNFYEWDGAKWNQWDKEKWQSQNDLTKYTKEGFQYKLDFGNGSGFFVEPSLGQFKDGGRGDRAFAYVTRIKENIDEGRDDLPTIGPCCNSDYRQGPEKFIEPFPEKIVDTNLAFWYVSQMKNDDRKNMEYCWAESILENGIYVPKVYPCFAGPMFVPIKENISNSQIQK